jgi:hypothetical protein
MNLENNRAGSDGLHGLSWKALASGAAGAATVTLAHEVVRQLVPDPPRMDRLGMAALARVLRATGSSVPRGEKLRGYTMVGDLVGNALFYAPVAMGRAHKRPLLRGLALGVAAGLGAVLLTPVLGLPRRHRGLTLRTKAITVGLYALGGVAAAAMSSLLDRPMRARALGGDVDTSSGIVTGLGLEPQAEGW